MASSWYYRWFYDVKIKFGENEFYYKILKDDIMVGFVGLDLRDDEVLNQHTLYINRLYIDEEYRNMGIGEEVIKKIIDIAKDMNRDIELEVFGNNPEIHLYLHLIYNYTYFLHYILFVHVLQYKSSFCTSFIFYYLLYL